MAVIAGMDMYISESQVGCQAAIASRLAPTVGRGTSARDRSAAEYLKVIESDRVPLQESGTLLPLEKTSTKKNAPSR